MSLITVAQAAELMSVSARTAYNMASDGRLPVVRMRGRSMRVHLEKLEAMLDQEAAASMRTASGVPEENECRTKETIRLTGGSATSYQLENTLDALLGQKTTRRPRR